MRSSESIIAVFERQPYWGPELQRQFTNSSVSVRECRKVHDLDLAIAGCMTAVCVIDLAADVADCLGWLRGLKRDLPTHFSIIASGSPEHAELEWVLREAGVTVFLTDVIPGDHFARLCRKLLGFIGKIR